MASPKLIANVFPFISIALWLKAFIIPPSSINSEANNPTIAIIKIGIIFMIVAETWNLADILGAK